MRCNGVAPPTNIRKFIINLPGTMALAAAIAIVGSGAAWQAARAQSVPTINARVVATNIPGASAVVAGRHVSKQTPGVLS